MPTLLRSFALASVPILLLPALGAQSPTILDVDPVRGDDNNPGTPAAPFRTVRAATAAAPPGATLRLAAGDYDAGQGRIEFGSKDLIVVGAGIDRTILRPDPGDSYGVTWGRPGSQVSRTQRSVVLLDGPGSLHLQDLTVDVSYRTSGVDQLVGIHVQGGGDLTSVGVRVTGVRDEPRTDAQFRHGIAARGDVPNDPSSVRLVATSVDDFGKNGVSVYENVDLEMDRCVVRASGLRAFGEAAQNGVQITYGARGTVRLTTVTGADYLPFDVSSTGILLVDAGTSTIQGNTVSGCRTGVYVEHQASPPYAPVRIADNTIHLARVCVRITGSTNVVVERNVLYDVGTGLSSAPAVAPVPATFRDNAYPGAAPGSPYRIRTGSGFSSGVATDPRPRPSTRRLDWVRRPLATFAGTLASLRAEDLDGDGTDELLGVVRGQQGLDLQVLDEIGGTWSTLFLAQDVVPFGAVWIDLLVGDFDGDGPADVLVAPRSSLPPHEPPRIVFNTAAQFDARRARVPLFGVEVRAVAVGARPGIDRIGILGTVGSDSRIMLLEPDTFVLRQVFVPGSCSGLALLEDQGASGEPRFAVGSGSTLEVYRGTTRESQTLLPGSVASLVATDLDGDGALELVSSGGAPDPTFPVGSLGLLGISEPPARTGAPWPTFTQRAGFPATLHAGPNGTVVLGFVRVGLVGSGAGIASRARDGRGFARLESFHGVADNALLRPGQEAPDVLGIDPHPNADQVSVFRSRPAVSTSSAGTGARLADLRQPSLTVGGEPSLPYPGNTTFFAAARTLPARAPVVLLVGQGLLPQPRPGSVLVGTIAGSVSTTSTVAGEALFALPIPASPRLEGQEFVLQAAVLDPGARGGPALGVATTQGMVVTIGLP